MKKSFGFAVVTFCVVFGASGAGQTVQIGVGGTTCGEFALAAAGSEKDVRAAGTMTMAVSWVHGFVLGGLMVYDGLVAPESKLIIRTPDSAAVSLWLKNYCQPHPLDDMVRAAATLMGEVRERALKPKP
jgi:hypothetical protein